MAEENEQPPANTDPKPNNEKKTGPVPGLPPNLATVVCSYHAEERTSLDALNKGADFIYGVIVALAISKAVESFLHSFPARWFLDPLHAHSTLSAGINHLGSEPEAEPQVRKLLQLFRLIIFLMTIVRFYFGSIIYLEGKKHNFPQTRDKLADKRRQGGIKEHHKLIRGSGISYLADFLSGIFHFAGFFAWSLTLTQATSLCQLGGASPFLVLMAAILMFDVVWWFLLHFVLGVEGPKITIWICRNIWTVVISFGVFLIAYDVLPHCGIVPQSRLIAEMLAFIPVALVNYEDALELIEGRKPKFRWLFARW